MTKSNSAAVKSWRALIETPLALGASVALLIVVIGALGADWLAPYPPEQIDTVARLVSPNGNHLLGTDELGRDMFSRLMYGSRVSLQVACASVAVSAILGVALGGIAATWGGRVQTFILRLTDIVLAFPEILLAIVLMAVLGPSLVNVVIAIAAAYAPRFVRITWSSLLVVREQTYIEAARAAGSGKISILLRHMLPNITPVLLVQATLSLGSAILVESSLSFLGLGIQPPAASLGSMINSAQLYLTQSIYPVATSGLMIIVIVLALNFIGDALAEAFDPKLASITVRSRRKRAVIAKSTGPQPSSLTMSSDELAPGGRPV